MKSLLARILGVTRIVALNTSWLETQDARLKRLEQDYAVLRREADAIKRYEQRRGATGQ